MSKTHLARDEVSWRTACGIDLTESVEDAISLNPKTVNCDECIPQPVQALAGEPDYGEPAVNTIAKFMAKPLEFYEDETFDKAIYPGKGTGDSIALSYTLAGRINELGEYCEKFLPIVESACCANTFTPQESADQKTLGDFIDILRMMIGCGKKAHVFKKPLRKGLTKLPRFRPFTKDELEELDAEDGDSHWYGFRHTTERAGRRSIARILLENILKLRGRKERKTIEGDGDKR